MIKNYYVSSMEEYYEIERELINSGHEVELLRVQEDLVGGYCLKVMVI